MKFKEYYQTTCISVSVIFKLLLYVAINMLSANTRLVSSTLTCLLSFGNTYDNLCKTSVHELVKNYGS